MKKNVLIAILAVAVIAAAGVSIYFNSTRKPQDGITPAVHQAIGEALAEEVVQALNRAGNIVLITLEEGQSPELDKYVDAFKDRIYDTPIKIARTDSISSEKTEKYGPGTGMSGKRFVRIMQKHHGADAIVSFVGTPDGEDEELKELKEPLPKFIAFSREPDDLDELFEDKRLYSAIVPRFQFPAPGPDKPKTTQDYFTRNYQIVRADTQKAAGQK